MQALRSIKLLVSIAFTLAFLAFILIGGVGGAYLDRNPDKAAAYAFGTMNVDPKASFLDQAGQLVQGYKQADKSLSALKKFEVEAADDDMARRSQEFMEERYGPLSETSAEGAIDPTPVSDAVFE